LHVEDDLLPLSALEHLVFCERQCALIHIEQLWDESAATVEGHHLHDSAHDVGTDSRGDVRIARGLMLRSLRLGLSGKSDVVEFHQMPEGEAGGAKLEGVDGLWRPFPVEYKRGRKRAERSYEVQVCAQALCLEEMLGVSVREGALFYGKTARRQAVVFDDSLREETEKAAERLHELFRLRSTPKAVYVKNKCRQCSLVDVCLPKQTGASRSVSQWLARATADSSPQPSPQRGEGEEGETRRSSPEGEKKGRRPSVPSPLSGRGKGEGEP
jgi:CRISPR-associated exonuclease Cas4